MKSTSIIIVVIMVAMMASACKQPSEYTQLVKSEIASDVRNDHLMLGLNFGDTDKEFFGKAWELNKIGKVTHGPKNMNIKYMMKDSLGKDIMVLFYPEFDSEKKIKRMDFEFSYLGWSPWTTNLFPDQLIPIVRDTLMAWYPGNEFYELEVNNEKYWGKIDGNRRIAVKMEGEKAVLAKVFDMYNEENKLN